ncbi:MAG: hypothetical protein ABIE25_02680 [Thermoplasmatota archaeon]
MSSRIERSDPTEEVAQAEISYSHGFKSGPPKERRGISTKVVVVIVVAIVLGSAGLFVWFEYLRHWSMMDVIEEVINDPYVGTPGFSHSLAGRKIVVEGEVTNITTRQTTQGPLSLIELDHCVEIHLVVWGAVPYEAGKKISTEVMFEWSVCNEERHVLSPQLDFPNIATLPAIGVVVDATTCVAGAVLVGSATAGGGVLINVFDAYPPIHLHDLNCALRAGTSSFANEYVDVMGLSAQDFSYGRGLEAYSDLYEVADSTGMLRFNDSDNDGFLSRDDSFTITNLPMPDPESGFFTYALVMKLTNRSSADEGPAIASYIVMTNKGLLRFTDGLSPYARMSTEETITGAESTIVRISEDVQWSDVRIILSDGMSMNDIYWEPSTGNLDNEPGVVEELGSMTLGTILVQCAVTDLAGNGLIDEGDFFTVSTWGGTSFSAATNYTLTVLYEPMSTTMCHSRFSG